jgi:hypothetical protein
MPDDQGHVTLADLERDRDRLNALIEEAQRLSATITEHLHRVRRGTHREPGSEPAAAPARRKPPRHTR